MVHGKQFKLLNPIVIIFFLWSLSLPLIAQSNSEELVEWDYYFNPFFSWRMTYGFIVLIIIASIILIWQYRIFKNRYWLIFLRTLSTGLIIAYFLSPNVEKKTGTPSLKKINIIYDNSQSLNQKENNIHEKFQKTVTNNFLKSAQPNNLYFTWQSLNGDKISPENLNDVSFTDKTPLINKLTDSINKDFLSILLFSDGRETEGSPEKFLKDIPLDIPINVVLPEDKMTSDAKIVEVLNSDIAFIRNTFEVEASVYSEGINEQANLSLYENGQLLETQTVQLKAGETNSVNFKLKKDSLGFFDYKLILKTQTQETIEDNNVKYFTVQIIRDKIRVLHIAGHPSYDVRFLRQHLKENPNVDLISFFILRTTRDIQKVNHNEMSLIAFPREQLFKEKLDDFDVIVFQDFDYREYDMAKYLPYIKKAVLETGLGVVFIGEEDIFGEAYAGTPLEELFPVMLNQGLRDPQELLPTLSEFGETHPITRIEEMGFTFSAENFPKLLIEGVKTPIQEDSISLITNNEGDTLLGLRSFQKGRIAAFTTNQLWRWRFSEHPQRAKSDAAYHRIWSNILKLLVKDPDQAKINLRVSPKPGSINKKMKFEVQSFNENFRPLKGAPIYFQLYHRNNAGVLELKKEDQKSSQEDGTVSFNYTPLSSGTFIAKASLSPLNTFQKETDPLSSDILPEISEERFHVAKTSKEFINPFPDIKFLQALAKKSGGKVFGINDLNIINKINILEKENLDIKDRKVFELIHNPFLVFVIFLLLFIEWFLRKRQGDI